MNHSGRVICKHVLSINTTTVTTNTTTNMGMDTDSQVWEYCEPLFSKHEQCDDYQGDLAMSDDDPSEVALYMRNGTKFSQHFTKICSNRWCTKRLNHGYSVKGGEKIFDIIGSEYSYLLSSNETGFSIDYLYECTLHFLHSNASMQGMADVYNQLHNFLVDKNWLDDSILNNLTALKTVWCDPHDCKADNCEGLIISDGGMKIHHTVPPSSLWFGNTSTVTRRC